MSREDTTVLLSRAKDGSPEAIGDVLDRVGDRLLAFIRLRLGRKLRSQIEARDILQLTLLRAFDGFDGFQGSSSETLMSWMCTIARNEINRAARHFNREKRDPEKVVALEELGPASEIAVQVRTEVSRLHLKRNLEVLEEALERLAEDHREVILLRKYEELCFAEVGERLNRSAEASRKLFARAMTALSEEMIALTRQRGGERK